MKVNVWHSTEQGAVDASIDQWRARFKECTHAEGEHFKHML